MSSGPSHLCYNPNMSSPMITSPIMTHLRHDTIHGASVIKAMDVSMSGTLLMALSVFLFYGHKNKCLKIPFKLFHRTPQLLFTEFFLKSFQ